MLTVYLQTILPLLGILAAPITGSVVDAETGTPLAGVDIFIHDSTLSTTTGDDGTFAFPAVPSGIYTIVIRRKGYEPLLKEVNVATGEQSIVNVFLWPERDETAAIGRTSQLTDHDEQYERFTTTFLGREAPSYGVWIENADALILEDRGDTTSIRAEVPVQIVNPFLEKVVEQALATGVTPSPMELASAYRMDSAMRLETLGSIAFWYGESLWNSGDSTEALAVWREGVRAILDGGAPDIRLEDAFIRHTLRNHYLA